MATFTFEDGYKVDAKQLERTKIKRTSTKRVFGANCQCFDLGLKCFHKVKERTTSIPDLIIQDSGDTTPAWMQHFAIERNQNTQRHKAG